MLVKELQKATNATEAIPAERLSAIIIEIKKIASGSKVTSKAKRQLVKAANIEPSNKTK